MKDPIRVLERLEQTLKDDLEYFETNMKEVSDKETLAYNEGCKDTIESIMVWLEHFKESY